MVWGYFRQAMYSREQVGVRGLTCSDPDACYSRYEVEAGLMEGGYR